MSVMPRAALACSERDVSRIVVPAHAEGMPVVELEPVPLGAAPTFVSTKPQRAPSRSRTARRTAAGMWREAGAVLVSESSLRGALVFAKRRASSRASVWLTAWSTTAARSPSGTWERKSARSRSSLSWSSALAVNWTL